jgi:AraC-like DNA-binding protein
MGTAPHPAGGSRFPAGPHRADGAVRAGTYSVEVADGRSVSGWHSHDFHQLEYAFHGVIELETETARYLLPPHQAAWIPAGVKHSNTLSRVKSVSVFFDPAAGLPEGDRVRVLAVVPVVREMIGYATRWPIARSTADPMADSFFRALAHLVAEGLDREAPLCLPTSRHPLVAAVIEYTREHLADVTLREVCAAVGTSERSVRRAFPAHIGMSWRQYLLQSRLLEAMSLLVDCDRNVLAIAHGVGFQSVSAFTRAFGRYTGETPTEYRRRMRGAPTAATAQEWSAELITRTILPFSHWHDVRRAG